jgi:hypothetical protein
MDESRFDQLARTVVTRMDRRRVLQGVSGLVAALLGTSRGMEMTDAKGSTRRKRRVHAERHTGGGKPQGRCAVGKTNCRGKCVDLADNPNHCGACATECSPGKNCCAGICTEGPCPALGPELCSNGLDDNGDGFVDCSDPACADDPACQIVPEVCSNGVDDDGDGLVDSADPDCQG